MKILIVGGAGYIGGAITDQLMDSGHDIKVYDTLLYEESYRKPVPFVYGDLRSREALLPLLKWADTVVWLAALVGDGACALNPDVAEEINYYSVKWLADNFHGRIVFMSTCSVYGAQDKELDEQSPTNPLSVYASTKLAAEKALEGKNAIIFRLGTIYGVGDIFSRIRLDLVVNILVVKAHTTGVIRVFGGDQFRPLLHVKDAARAVVDNIGTSHTGIYNLHRQNVRIIDLAYQVRNHFPDLVIEQTEMSFQDARNYRVKSDKAIATFGFKPQYSIDDGIEEVKDLVINNRIKDVNNPRFTNQVFLETYKTHLL
ncbi:SDR family oxidoreductase [Geobacter sp. FeAm09]|uniref:NAD-dependent epimerase/dehydratase family protein n=1 Tax=Geobacter sp. FeAm09 TaxID=2597769 RepID=UPI0011EEC7AC|nr:SDR family oxidoreductase [Geobacter sp. FeAm09]QEM69767.1 SDR family oxidoreductase [Geobacter sp. FeAm09]